MKKNLFGDAVDGVIGVGGDHKRTKLERRQSVAVMENLSNRHTNKTPKKSKHRQEMRTPRCECYWVCYIFKFSTVIEISLYLKL